MKQLKTRNPDGGTRAGQVYEAFVEEYGYGRHSGYTLEDLTIFWNGQDHAFFEFRTGTARADREPSGRWKVVILSSWIS